MYSRVFVFLAVFIWSGLAFSADNFEKEIVLGPKTTETVVVPTDVPVSFIAQFVDTDISEAKKCGLCLHIKTVSHGTKNELDSTWLVGFSRVPPENGRISVKVSHDFGVAKKIKITAKPVARK